jgi:hypothetical protein
MKLDLSKPPRLFRSTVCRGLEYPAAGGIVLATERSNVDHEDPGTILGMAIITRGEALGHGGWIDRQFLQQVTDAINAKPEGAKGRFTHPSLSGDGLGKFTGRVKDARLERDDVVRGDLHFSATAHKTPDGDLAGYLMNLAQDDPAAFGNSIAFDRDVKAEERFALEHGAVWDQDDWGNQFLNFEKFKSPDPKNTGNLPHFRLKSLHAVDAVDDPAANPNGLFHRGDEVARDAEQLLAWSLGLSAEKPQLVSLDIDPDRVGGFVQRFLARNNLTLSRNGKPMSLSELDASLAKQLGSTISPDTAAKLKKTRLAADKDDRDEDREERGEEEGDADKDEGKDKGKKEAGGDFGAKGAKTLATKYDNDEEGNETKMDDDDEDEKLDDDDKEEKKDTTGLSKKKLAKGGDNAKGTAPGDQGAVQDEYQDVAKEESEGSEDDAKEGTPVESPSKKKEKGIGPMGDPSNNVGYSKADCKKFFAAFGANAAEWMAEGKTFAEAQELHTAALTAENEKLKKENADLAQKAAKHRGLSKPLNAGGEASSISPEEQKLSMAVGGGNSARFALGIAADLAKFRRN